MFRGWTDGHRTRSIARFAGVVATLTVVALPLMLSAPYARACPTEMQSGNRAPIALSVEAAGVATSDELGASLHGYNLWRRIRTGPCREGNSHSGASACQFGCCPGSTAAIGVTLSDLQCPEGSTHYHLSAEDGITSIGNPRQFRSPRSTA